MIPPTSLAVWMPPMGGGVAEEDEAAPEAGSATRAQPSQGRGSGHRSA